MAKKIYIDDSVEFSDKLVKHLRTDESLNVQLLNVTDKTELPDAGENNHIVLLVKSYHHGRDKIDFLLKLRKTNPNILCVLLTGDDGHEHAIDALKLGINGFVHRNSALCVIIDGIYQVLNGGLLITAQMTRHMIKKLLGKTSENLHKLTPREKQILEILARGHLYKEIAHQLNISILTVKNHLKNIYRKLEVNNRSEAIVKFFGK